MTEVGTVLNLRSAQRRFMRMVDQHRLVAFLARRQFGKTTTFSAVALKKMMKQRDHTIIFGSAKLNLSREIVRKEAAIMQSAISALRAQVRNAARVQVIDGKTGENPDVLNEDDFAELFEAQRLEFRYYHSDSCYSRTKVVALLPDTVGETGDLMMDEVGRVKNFREVWEAVEPIVQSNPKFRLAISTTPPPDDSHFSFEMLAPPIGIEFETNKEGNVYKSDMGVTVLRVDAFDAFADGVPVYDLETAEPLPPAEHRRRAHDKDAWDRNYGVLFVMGGTSACGLMQLDVAQKRGMGKCEHFQIYNDGDFDRAIEFIKSKLGSGQVGIGNDVATTTKQTSNPTSITVLERNGVEFAAIAIITWKTRDPEIAEDRINRVVDAVKSRKDGGPAKKLCIDGTNERYFAARIKTNLGAKIPVEVIVSSETIHVAGIEDDMNYKTYLGDKIVDELDDNHLALPPQKYIREDWRLPKKERGAYSCEADADGKHGDTFDSTKLALYALISRRGNVTKPHAPKNSKRYRVLEARRNRQVAA